MLPSNVLITECLDPVHPRALAALACVALDCPPWSSSSTGYLSTHYRLVASILRSAALNLNLPRDLGCKETDSINSE